MAFNIGKRYFSSNKIIVLAIFMLIFGICSLTCTLGLLFSGANLWIELLSELRSGSDEAMGVSGIVLGMLAFMVAETFGLLFGGIMIIVSKAKRRVSNETYEKNIAAYPENIALRARNSLNLPENEKLLAPAMQFEDYKYHNVNEVKHSMGRVRTDLYEKSVILLTEKYLYCYSLRFRTTKQEEVVNTEMLSYQDIISITLTQKNDTLRREAICIKHLEITTVGGNVIKLPYRYDEQAQRDVNIIRQVLREKKSTTETV